MTGLHVSIQYMNVMDGRTDGQSPHDDGIGRAVHSAAKTANDGKCGKVSSGFGVGSHC